MLDDTQSEMRGFELLIITMKTRENKFLHPQQLLKKALFALSHKTRSNLLYCRLISQALNWLLHTDPQTV